MKIDDIRNVGIAGHGGVGKTILAEAMLYTAGVITRMGTVEDGSTVSDFHNQEMERQISISTSMMNLSWQDHKVNIVDCPGYLDFIGEVYGAMHVVDIGLVVLDGSSGIEVGTEISWKYARKHDLSKFIVINKLDKENINFEKVVEEVRTTFGDQVILAQFPYNSGENFDSIIDLIRGKMLVYDDKGHYREEPIPADAKEAFDDARLTFMESIIEHDESLMDKYLSDELVTEDELKHALSQAVKHNQIYPVICTSAKSCVGISRLLEIIVKYGASASDLPDVRGKDGDENEVTLECKKDGPFAAQIFKTISEPHVGELSFVKVYSGTLKVGSDIYNANNQTSERVSTLYLINGKTRKDTEKLETGDMGAIIKLKHSHTNDTLCDPNHPIIIDQIRFPQPVIRAAMVSLNKGDEDKVGMGLASLHQEDPTFHFSHEAELHQTIVSGQGELQLDVIVRRLKNRFNVEVDLEAPHIPYRETIRKTASLRKKYKKQSGGRGQYADVEAEFKPLHRGGGFKFINNIVGGAIPTKFIPAVEKGIKQAMDEGSLIGSKVVDISARIYDGSYHSVDSSDMAFQIAGSQALKEGMAAASPIILEPIYELEIRMPEEYMGAVMGDISSRRGKVLGMEPGGQFLVVQAEVPLAELWKYSTQLRSLTQGRGNHVRKFSHYEQVPREEQAKLVEAYAASKAQED